ncbi:Uncharacterised protein [Chlamydia abortus]|nr:Uncharacterised protein [Chlamydia abortus]
MLKMKTLKSGYAVYIPQNNEEGRAIVESFLRKGIDLDVRPLSQVNLRVSSKNPKLVTAALEFLEDWQRDNYREGLEWRRHLRELYRYEEEEAEEEDFEDDFEDFDEELLDFGEDYQPQRVIEIDRYLAARTEAKTCTKCGETKPLDDFYKQKDGKHGRRGDCIECTRKRQSEGRKRKAGGR